MIDGEGARERDQERDERTGFVDEIDLDDGGDDEHEQYWISDPVLKAGVVDSPGDVNRLLGDGKERNVTNVSRNMRFRKDEMAFVDKTVNDPVRPQRSEHQLLCEFPRGSGTDPTKKGAEGKETW